MDTVNKWPGSAHDRRIFQNSSLKRRWRMVQYRYTQNALLQTEIQYLSFLLADPAYPLVPYVMKEFLGSEKNHRERFFSFKFSSVRIAIENAFGQFKGRFGCLRTSYGYWYQRITPSYYGFFCLTQLLWYEKEKVPEPNIISSLNHEKRAQPSSQPLGCNDVVNEKMAKEKRNILTLNFKWDNF